MGWGNPPISWKELERRLSGLPGADDAPVSRPKRRRLEPVEVARDPSAGHTPYAELHCHSHYSFLDGASSPAELVGEAVRLGLHGLAVTDHDGFYGAPMLAEAAAAHPSAGLRTVYGAELSLGLGGPQNGVPDPEGDHLLVLARGVEGYHRLAAAMTAAQLRGDEKGRPVYDVERARRPRPRPLDGPHRLPQGDGPLGPRRRRAQRGRRGAGPAAPGCSGSTTWLWSCRRARTRPPTRRTSSWPLWPATTGCRSWPPATCTTPPRPRPGWPRRWPPSGPAAASTEMDGWLGPVGRGPPAQRRRDGPGAAPLAGRGSAQRGARRRARLRPPQGLPAAAQAPHPPGAHGRLLAAGAGVAGLRRAVRRPAARRGGPGPHRARAAGDGREGLRRLLRDRPRHRRLRPQPGDPLPGPRFRGQLGGLLRPGRHRGRRDLLPAALRAVHLRAPRRGARHRRRLRLRPSRGGHPVGLRHLRPAQRRAGGQRDHLPAEDGGARHGQGARVTHRPAGRLVEADRRMAGGGGGRPRRPVAHDVPPRSWPWPTS